ncbi:hypothetical protein PCE1_003270 [Barthelona sp. PCE]
MDLLTRVLRNTMFFFVLSAYFIFFGVGSKLMSRECDLFTSDAPIAHLFYEDGLVCRTVTMHHGIGFITVLCLNIIFMALTAMFGAYIAFNKAEKSRDVVL